MPSRRRVAADASATGLEPSEVLVPADADAPGEDASGAHLEFSGLSEADESPAADTAEAVPSVRADDTIAELEALRELLETDPEAFDVIDLPVPLAPAHVTAVLVAHDGQRWLPEVLDALRDQTREPDRLVAVDTGSIDETPSLLEQDLGHRAVTRMSRNTGFGAAVNEGLERSGALATEPIAAGVASWIWLLHDDCAPEPTALEELLRAATLSPSVEVFGPKVRDFDDPRVLVEVGLTVDRSGRRVTHLDPGELDQGQHDQARDVLAVGTAGALITVAAWERYGGLDPRLPLFRDDLDLGWRVTRGGGRVRVVPEAVVRHARAVATGRRHADAAPGIARRVDRSHALLVMLANCTVLGLALGLPRAVLAGLVRSLGFLITRRPHLAADELAAVGTVLKPGRLGAARSWRAATAPHGHAAADAGEAIEVLLVPRGARLRAALGAGGDWLTGGSSASSAPPAGSETGPVSEDAEELLPADDVSRLRRLLTRPAVLGTALFALLALIADRHLLGTGELFGGRLYPVPASARDLWRDYASTWHPAANGGSSTPVAPWTPWLAIPSSIFGGSVGFTVGLLLLFAAPGAWLAAWWAQGPLELPLAARLWAAGTYAVLPVLVGDVATGRFDATVAYVSMPLLLRSGATLVSRSRRRSSTRSAWSLGIGLAAVSAFSPPVWAFAVVAVGLCALFRLLSGALRAALRLLIPLAVAPLLALPWLPRFAADPGVLLTGLGRPGGLAGQAAQHSPTGPQLLAFIPAGPGGSSPGAPTHWLLVPLLLAALSGLLVAERRLRLAAGLCWGLGVLGWAAAAASTRVDPLNAAGERAWPGAGLALAAAAILAACALAAGGLRARLTSSSFGLRQVSAVVLVFVCLALPLAIGVRWVVRGAQGPLTRAAVNALPADVLADAAARGPGERALFLRSSADGTIDYTLTGLDGPHLGDEDQVATPAAARIIKALVADLDTARGTDAAELLSTFNVHVIAVLGGGRDRLTEALDSQPALSRRDSGGYDGELWQLTVPASRLEVLAPDLAAAAQHPAAVDQGVGRGPARAALAAEPPLELHAGTEGAAATLPAGPGGRLLVLSDSADGGWRATVGGRSLRPVRAWGWEQAFALPAGGGRLLLSHAASGRTTLILLQAGALLLVLIFAAPTLGRDRRGEDGLDGSEGADDDAEEPSHPVAVPHSLERLRAGRLA